MSYLGIDLGTSALKAVVLGEDGEVLAVSSAPLDLRHPHPQWSEQDPEAWWSACVAAIGALDDAVRARITGIGLTGQMHGTVLLDKNHAVLRPAILWNDVRSHAYTAALEPLAVQHAGNLALAGFSAPKLLWLREHEPEVFDRIGHILLPKDYLRFRLTEDFATDMADASGTLWLDPEERAWSAPLIAFCGLDEAMLPRLYEGTRITGMLSARAAEELSLPVVPVAAGEGDQAAGAVGVGALEDGDAFLSLGTSGVVFAATDIFRLNPNRAVHAFCHAVPDRWHVMSVMMGTGASIAWFARLGGFDNAAAAVTAGLSAHDERNAPVFLPYLTGERTPHNDPEATGAFTGLTLSHGPEHLMGAVLEGVAFALADGVDALRLPDAPMMVTVGGTRSDGWMQFLADVLGRTLLIGKAADVGPATGAARLAAMAVSSGEPPGWCSAKPPTERAFEPQRDRSIRRETFEKLYPAIRQVSRSPRKDVT